MFESRYYEWTIVRTQSAKGYARRLVFNPGLISPPKRLITDVRPTGLMRARSRARTKTWAFGAQNRGFESHRARSTPFPDCANQSNLRGSQNCHQRWEYPLFSFYRKANLSGKWQ